MSDQNPPLDMNAILQQAQQMGEQLMAAQQEAAAQVYEGQSGGGAVKITMSGGFESVTQCFELAITTDEAGRL